MSKKLSIVSMVIVLPVLVAVTAAFAFAGKPKAEAHNPTAASASAAKLDTVDEADSPYHPTIDPASFSEVVNNPYFTLTPGTTYTYKSQDDEGTEINKVTVTDRAKKVMGITTRVVWDRVWLNDQLIEETYDWYAQDKKGKVWYFGEDSKEYKKGKVVSRKGSWEAGVKGAQPGIVMQSNPQPGEPYRQEYLKGEAEDMGQVQEVSQTVKVPYGSFKNCIKTKDWSAIEAGSVEHKYYSKEVGNVVLETEHDDKKRVELVSVTTTAKKRPHGKK